MTTSVLGDALHYSMFPEGVVVDVEGRCRKVMWLMEDGRRDDGTVAIGTNYFMKDLCHNIFLLTN